jgi:GT2 family glycosyltransferase
MTTSPPRVVTVILNWNQRELTLACLEVAGRSDYRNHRPLLVDNGSSDGSVSAVQDRFPGVACLEAGANLGYAGGNNLGLRRALELGADYVLLLNNDAFLAEGTISEMVQLMDSEPAAGAVGPTIVYDAEPARVWCAGAGLRLTDGHTWRLHAEQRVDDLAGSAVAVSLLSGCALMLRRAALEQVGLLDERYFLYYEEADWCVRAAAAGWRLLWLPSAIVRHRVAASSESAAAGRTPPRVTYYMTRNRMLFLSKHLHGPQRLMSLAHAALDTLRLILVRTLRLDREDRRARWRAMRDFLAGRFGPAPF